MWIFSDLKFQADMGLLLTFMFLVNMLGAIVLLPAARNGLLAAVLLGVGRAVGETMIVAIAAGLQPKMTINPLESAATVTIDHNTIAGNSHDGIYMTVSEGSLDKFTVTNNTIANAHPVGPDGLTDFQRKMSSTWSEGEKVAGKPAAPFPLPSEHIFRTLDRATAEARPVRRADIAAR
mgnify:CR=1 FL=1